MIMNQDNEIMTWSWYLVQGHVLGVPQKRNVKYVFKIDGDILGTNIVSSFKIWSP